MKSDKSYLGAGIPSVLVTLIILLVSCFAALTFVSASSDMKLSEKSAAYCSDYYQAETTATEILAAVFGEDTAPKSQITKDKNSNLVYNDNDDNILIDMSENGVTFTVPINKKQSLDVNAKIKGDNIDIVQWVVR